MRLAIVTLLTASGCVQAMDDAPLRDAGATDASSAGDAWTGTDAGPGLDAGADDAGPSPDGGPPLPDLNPGWVGGACTTAADCSSADFTAAPMCERDGFPGGMCTQECMLSAGGSWLCPDTTYGPGTENTITRCITTADGSPACASQCDYTRSPTGCRDGYACVMRVRHGSRSSAFPVCLPAESGGWPGEPVAPFDIGASCVDSAACAHDMCLAFPDGYCTKAFCDTTGCPTGSTCVFRETDSIHLCLRDCAADRDCRTGYACDADEGVCLPVSVGTGWDPVGGAADCATVWGTAGSGLSVCDSTPDDYVVVRKGARNVALCNRGTLVASYHGGLGFAPVGDKERQGDGRTPEGVFYIPRRVPASTYYRAFLLSYPDSADAARGYRDGLITVEERDAIVAAQAACGEPPQSTGLGGLVELHGEGGGVDWTAGCIALENFEIDAIWAVLDASDTIAVLP